MLPAGLHLPERPQEKRSKLGQPPQAKSLWRRLGSPLEEPPGPQKLSGKRPGKNFRIAAVSAPLYRGANVRCVASRSSKAAPSLSKVSIPGNAGGSLNGFAFPVSPLFAQDPAVYAESDEPESLAWQAAKSRKPVREFTNPQIKDQRQPAHAALKAKINRGLFPRLGAP